MKKLLISAYFLLFLAFFSFSNEQSIITVLDFEISGVSKQEMILFIDYLSSNITGYGDYRVIDRRQRNTRPVVLFHRARI